MHSIILALGIARLLGGVADLSRLWGKIGSERLLALWLFQLLMLHIGWWFGLWHAFHDSTDIPLWMFVLSLSIPASFYVASRLLVPNSEVNIAVDFADRFQEIRIPFYWCIVISAIPYSGVRYAFFEGTSNQFFILVMGGIAICGLFIRNIRAHFVIAISIVIVYSTFLYFARGTIGIDN